MSGRHPFSELTKDLTPKRRRRIDEMKRELLAEMPLHELRRARALTQRDLAELLKVNQPAVSKLEQRADAYVSSLRSYIEAVGREVEDRRRVPGGGRRDHQLLRRGRLSAPVQNSIMSAWNSRAWSSAVPIRAPLRP